MKVLALAILVGIGMAPHAAAQAVMAYPPADYSIPSTDITSLTVGGQTVFVEKFQDYQYAHFSFASPVECIITAKEKIETHAIQPMRRGYQGQAAGNTLKFTLSHLGAKPGYAVVQINKLGRLILLGDKPETDAPDPKAAGVRLVTAAPYNADNTGAANVTAILQKAIADASAAGGGVVYVPAGTYKVIQTLVAKSKVSLYLAPGARIRSSTNRTDYGGGDFIDAMIETNNVSDFRLFGRGTLDASGMEIMVWENTSMRRRLFSGGGTNKNISIEGVVLRGATTWTLVVQNTDSCLVRNVKIINHWNQAAVKIQNDGIDLCGSRRGLAEGNFVITGDDAMCAKANGKETAFLTFKDNTVLTFAAANKAGMQSTALMHDILFTGTDVIACRRGLVVESLEGAQPISGIRFEDIVIDGYHSLPGWSQKVVELLAEQSKISDVQIENVTSYGAAAEIGGSLDGLTHGIENVTFKGLRYGPTQILTAQAGKLSLKNADNIAFLPGGPVSIASPRSPVQLREVGMRFIKGRMLLSTQGRTLRTDGRVTP